MRTLELNRQGTIEQSAPNPVRSRRAQERRRLARVESVSTIVPSLTLQRTVGVVIVSKLSESSTRKSVDRVKHGLSAWRGANQVLFLAAEGSVQGDSLSPRSRESALKRLIAHREEHGRDGLVVVHGVDYGAPSDEGTPEVLDLLLADTNISSPMICAIGEGSTAHLATSREHLYNTQRGFTGQLVTRFALDSSGILPTCLGLPSLRRFEQTPPLPVVPSREIVQPLGEVRLGY